jgi:protocatechuate 3,4-dioxygenase beta subunit
MLPTRRALLSAFAAGAALSRFGDGAAETPQPPLDPTPGCGDSARPTAAQTEGPYFKRDAPLKRDLAADAPGGERITLAGFVLDTACRPVPNAIVQLWQADERGAYDHQGFRLRGHQLSDERGRWWFTTIVPGLYPGRTRHYHVKLQKPGGRVLTTQLYFPGEAQNRRDALLSEKLQLAIRDTADGKFGRYDFVLA